MKNLILLMSVFFITFSVSAQTDLFFSEYCEGSGNNKGVEIYNPTDQPIDLSNYYVVRFSNGSSVFTEGGVTQLEGTIQPYSTHVLVNGQITSTGTSPACSPIMQALADQLDHDYPAPTYMNGNDAIGLVKTPNGVPPTTTNITAVDLIGQTGLGSAISAETGWSYVQDSTLTYNDANGDPVTGKVINYIVQAKATDGVTYGPFWMSWTSDHTLIRKPEITQGITGVPGTFVVNVQWDTVPAKIDTATGFFVYKDIWDNLGSHACVADPNYNAAVNEFSFGATLNIYPNPVVAEYFTISSDMILKSVQVFDVVGKEIFNESFVSNQKEADISLGQKYNGILMVKVTFSNDKSAVQKILVK
jgi:hypothetical protein